MDRWQSGRLRRFPKPIAVKAHEFESHPIRKSPIGAVGGHYTHEGFIFLESWQSGLLHRS